jgi:hypothetical protein
MKRPVVGDEMVLVEGVDRRIALTFPVRVTKVGRKYFYVTTADPKACWRCRGLYFHIETGWQANTNRAGLIRVTTSASLDDLDNEARREQLTAQLRGLGVELGHRGAARRLTADQLAEILAIVEAAMS